MSSEPVLTASTVSGAIIALLAVFHVILDVSAVEAVVAALLPIVLSLLARGKVTPTAP